MGTLDSARLLISLSSLTWAVFLLLPVDSFLNKEYFLMSKIAGEEIWAVLFLTHSFWSFFTLRTGIRNTTSLILDGFLGCILWTSSTVLCFASYWPTEIDGFLLQLSNYHPPAAMSGEVWVSIASWWYLVRYWAEEDTQRGNRGS